MDVTRFVFRRADFRLEADRLVSFRREAFGRAFSTDEVLWFNFKHPYYDARAYVAEEKSTKRIASSICMLPFRYRVGGATTMVSLATGGATHPDFRGLGLFTRISQILVQQENRFGITCGIGYPNAAALPLHVAAGWLVPGQLSLFEKRGFERSAEILQPVERFDERYKVLYEEAAQDFDFIHVKDHRVLNWRYKQRPGVEYYCFEVGRSQLDGFIVLKKFKQSEVRKTHIVDFLARTEQSAHHLISVAEQFAEGSDLLNLWMWPQSPYESFFRSRGFQPTDQVTSVIFQCFGVSGLPKVFKPWIVLGDNDVY
jgi:GNAT superfamily N-acetyltransferase